MKITQWLRILCGASLFLFLCFFFFRPIETEDIWWHLSGARFIFENGRVPSVDPFPFESEKTRWIFSQWLGSCIYYVVFLLGGLWGLEIGRVLLFVGILSVFFLYACQPPAPTVPLHSRTKQSGDRQARRRMPISFVIAIAFILALSLGPRCLLRPFVFNLIFIQIFLILLFDHQHKHNSSKLFLIPLLGILWHNIHLGGFIYGILLVTIFLVTHTLNYFAYKKLDQNLASQSLKKSRTLLFILLAYGGSLLFTPYGLEGLFYPFEALRRDVPQLSDSIAELLPPGMIFSWDFWGLHVLFGISLLVLFFHRPSNLAHILLFVFSFFMFLFSRRGIDFFSLSMVYILADALPNFSWAKNWDSFRFSKRIDGAIYLIGLYG